MDIIDCNIIFLVYKWLWPWKVGSKFLINKQNISIQNVTSMTCILYELNPYITPSYQSRLIKRLHKIGLQSGIFQPLKASVYTHFQIQTIFSIPTLQSNHAHKRTHRGKFQPISSRKSSSMELVRANNSIRDQLYRIMWYCCWVF